MLRTALVLGLLSMVGPFAIDMYLPALPAIAAEFAISEAAVQATLTGYFIGFGLAQLVYGPLADQTGRKLPLYLGVAVFAAGSVGAALAPDIAALVMWRAVQGLGGAAVMVVPRAVIRDLHTGAEATRLMAMIMMVISVSPMLAPLAGSGVIVLAGWRAVFGVLAAVALASLVLTALALPETLPPDRRTKIRPHALIRASWALLRDRGFMGLTFIGGFGMASFFVFIASAAFVYRQQFGLSATGFSLAFAINALGFFSASQAAGPLGARLGMRRMVRYGVIGFFGFTAGLLGIALAGGASLWVIVAGLFCANACMGVVVPSTMVMALDDHGAVAGLASSLGGTLQMVAGGAAIVAAGPFFDGTALPMLAAIALCAAAALVLTLLVLGRDDPAGGAQRAAAQR